MFYIIDYKNFKIIQKNNITNDEKRNVVNFLIDVTIKEFGFVKWYNYLLNKDFTPYSDNSNFIILKNNDDIIATIALLEIDSHLAKINSFYVQKEYRNNKLGTQIYNLLMQKSKQYDTIILCTFEKFNIAKHFYDKNDFKLYKIDNEEYWFKKDNKNIKSYFLSTENTSMYNGKYALKDNLAITNIKNFQNDKLISNYQIQPVQFTFEITNKCNCNCPSCGMHANKITNHTKLNIEQLYTIVDKLYNIGIPSFAITGGEPFLEFDNICKMLKYANGKIDLIKIISNGFWGDNVEYYINKLIEAGLLNNRFFKPSICISIGEQNIKLETICKLINYIIQYTDKLNLILINTRHINEHYSKLEQLYDIYIQLYGKFPERKIYLTDSVYVNTSDYKNEIPVNKAICECDNDFKFAIGQFVSPKIFAKCNGDCYPCEVFNNHKNFFIGNYNNNFEEIIENLNNNKYVKFIYKYKTSSFLDVIPDKFLANKTCETSCEACQCCIEICEKYNLLR